MFQTVSAEQKIRFDELPDSAFIRLKTLIAAGVVPFSASTVWRKVKCKEFPHLPRYPTKLLLGASGMLGSGSYPQVLILRNAARQPRALPKNIHAINWWRVTNEPPS